jgi:hypothetical protein
MEHFWSRLLTKHLTMQNENHRYCFRYLPNKSLVGESRVTLDKIFPNISLTISHFLKQLTALINAIKSMSPYFFHQYQIII